MAERVEDGTLSAGERDGIVFALEAEWPFHAGVAGQTRREILAFGAERVALQMDATVEDAGQ